jgi:FkbM family methyltransferase
MSSPPSPSPDAISGWRYRLRNQPTIAKRLGLRGWFNYRLQDFRLSRAAPNEEVSVRTPLAMYPLNCRAHTSDHFAFAQVFADLAYASVPSGQQPDLIVDCGANVGYSAAYFLSRFRQCRLIALEPDAANYRRLEQNLAPYGARATCVHGALWSHQTNLQIKQQEYRDGGHWARQVEPHSAGSSAPVPGFDIPALINRAGTDRISILKIDIEGAEAVVFNHPRVEWLDRIDTIMIELHDDTTFGESTRIFHEAIAGRGFNVWNAGELTICSRLAPPR